MALTKFGSIITDSRGSIGGTTIKWGRYGHTTGRKGQPKKSATTKQSVTRATFALLSKRWWSTLDATQRTAWRDLAAANPLPNRWGDEFPLTGLSFYIRVNQRLIAADIGITDDAPADQTVTALTAATLTVTAPSTASLSFTPSTVPANHSLILRATNATSPGRTNVDGSYLALPAVGTGSTSPQNIASSLGSLVGAFATGRAYWLQAALLNTDNGARSPWVTTQAIAS